jgi:GTP-binding protein
MTRPAVSAQFVISAVKPADFPRDGRPEIALVGRSNVGKSSLINALVRQAVARTSSTPGKTRQVNVYRITAGSGLPFYLVDLPGYGHAGGGDKARAEFQGLTSLYFDSRIGRDARGRRPDGPRFPSALCGVVLAIDGRHPGLASDVEAWRWIASLGVPSLLVATKIDKLSQAEKARLPKLCEAAFGHPPLAASALAGAGLDQLWQDLHALSREPPLSAGSGQGQ